jgi:hypothetical protein
MTVGALERIARKSAEARLPYPNGLAIHRRAQLDCDPGKSRDLIQISYTVMPRARAAASNWLS